ncbi:MAG: N4-gp56 family major capsid protein [Eubacterium sp.]|nr:N4-gp56 family major capsid protein [Eubacterium sp.]
MEKINIQLHAHSYTGNSNTNVTNQGADTGVNVLTHGMKTYYDTELLKNARTQHYFAQFGKKTPLPKGRGKTVEWRKWDTIPAETATLQEGVTPDGRKLGQTNVTAAVNQYGDYAEISDVLELTYVDDVILGATEEFAAAGAETMDIVIRDAINSDTVSGQSVVFAPKSDGTVVTARKNATGVVGLDATCKITPTLINKIVTMLKKNKAPKINGDYVAIIHPSVAMDLRESEGWLNAHQYAQPEEIYNGEIGKLHGVRFVESTNAKVWDGNDESTNPGVGVYATYFFGMDAWGVVDPAGAGMEMIVKGKGSGGTADPLDQRSTVGYKFSTAAKVLYPERIIRLESASTFSATDASN